MSEIRRYSCDIDWAAKDGDLVRYSDYTALEAENRKLRDALSNIVANAQIQPDASMGGMTDVYAVPLDDIDEARSALGQKEQRNG